MDYLAEAKRIHAAMTPEERDTAARVSWCMARELTIASIRDGSFPPGTPVPPPWRADRSHPPTWPIGARPTRRSCGASLGARSPRRTRRGGIAGSA